MNIQVRLTSKEDPYIIKNLYPLFLYDLSEHYVTYPNIHGIYEPSDEFKTLADQYEVQKIWWEKPGCLYPFLFSRSSWYNGGDSNVTHLESFCTIFHTLQAKKPRGYPTLYDFSYKSLGKVRFHA